MKTKNIKKFTLLTFCLVFILSIFAFSSFALTDTTIDFTGISSFNKSSTSCVGRTSAPLVVGTFNGFDLNVSTLNNNCKYSDTQFDYYVYAYRFGSTTGSYFSTPLIRGNNNSLEIGQLSGATTSKWTSYGLVIDLKELAKFTSSSEILAEMSGFNITSKTRISYVSFFDENGNALYTVTWNLTNISWTVVSSQYFTGSTTEFNNNGTTFDYTYTETASSLVAHVDRTFYARYVVLFTIAVPDTVSTAVSSVKFYNITIQDYTPNECSGYVNQTNLSIVTSIFQEYFNYTQPYSCNNWVGTGNQNTPTNQKMQVAGSSTEYNIHKFLESESVTVEYDVNYTTDGIAVSLIDSNTQFLLANTIFTGNKIFVNSIDTSTITSANKKYHVKIYYTTFESKFYITITENGNAFYSGVQNTIYSNKPAGIDIYKYGLGANFNIDNIIVYQGNDMFINQNTIQLNSNVSNSGIKTDISNDFNNYLDKNGFGSTTSKLIFWLILMIIVMFGCIYILRDHVHHSGALVGIIGIIEVVMFILGYAFGFIPFWILFLIFVVCIIIIVAWIAQQVTPPTSGV